MARTEHPIPEYRKPYEIDWPISPLPPETMAEVVDNSRFKPLREIVARYVQNEGKQLLKIFSPDLPYAEWSQQQKDQFSSSYEYTYTMEILLTASQHVEDGRSLMEQQRLGLAIFYPGLIPEKELKKARDECIQALIIDPTGFDFLQRELEEQRRISQWINHADNASVIGMGIALTRYKQLYTQAVFAGAISDKKAGFVRRVTERTKREILDRTFLVRHL